MSLDIGRPLLYKLVFEGVESNVADVGSKLQIQYKIQYRPQLQTAVRILKFVILIMQLQTAI